MKYTKEQILSMSWQEWNETMAKELNAAGYLGPGYNPEKKCLDNHIAPYEANCPEREFVFGKITRSAEISHLKEIGLLNNGRCPMCGGEITGNPSQFTDGFNPNINFHICNSCGNFGRKISSNPANSSGCIVALLFLPYHLIKAAFSMII